jgi:glycosyltransferase involved in cell wall biosynthesis
MKILIVQEADWEKGGVLQQHHLAERLQKKGHIIRVIDFEVKWKKENEIYSSRKISFISRTFSNQKICVIRPAFLRLPLLVYLSTLLSHTFEIYKQIIEFKPDIIVGFDVPNSYIALKLAKHYKIPFIYYIIDINYLFIPNAFLQPISKWIEKLTVQEADGVIAINEMLKSFYVNEINAPITNTYIIRAGIDEKRFNTNINSNIIRQKYGIKENENVLFFMGWLYTFSGLEEVATQLLNHQFETNIKLLIVGKGELQEKLNLIKKKDIQNRIILVDWQPYENIPSFIAAADICLLPAHNNEIMRNIVPIKLYEYMACGKPVISTALQGVMKEFSQDNGIVFVSNTTKVLEKAVELITEKTVKLHGRKARKFVEKQSWDKVTIIFEQLLKNKIQNYDG